MSQSNDKWSAEVCQSSLLCPLIRNFETEYITCFMPYISYRLNQESNTRSGLLKSCRLRSKTHNYRHLLPLSPADRQNPRYRLRRRALDRSNRCFHTSRPHPRSGCIRLFHKNSTRKTHESKLQLQTPRLSPYCRVC